MKALVFDNRIGHSPLIDELIKKNSRFIDIIPIKPTESTELTIFRSSFRNYSPNSNEYEKLCFERYFYIKEYLEKNSYDLYDEFFMIDSDVEVLSSFKLDLLPEGLCLSQTKNDKSIEPLLSPHFSKWRVKDLYEFNSFILKFFQNSDKKLQMFYEYIQFKTGYISGISDMFVLYKFVQNRKWTNLNQFKYGVIHNLYSDYFDKTIDKIFGINNLTKGGIVKNNISVIHFQGGFGKNLIHKRINKVNLIIIGISRMLLLKLR